MVEKKKPEPETMWWEEKYHHPMSDEDFTAAYCLHLFATTNDRSLKAMREIRVFPFVRNYLAPELRKALAKYRETHA